MNVPKNRKLNVNCRLLAIILCLSILFSTSVNSAEPSYILDTDIYYIENCSSVGFIEPVTAKKGSYVTTTGYNYTTSQLWQFETYIYDSVAYFTIQSSKGEKLYLQYTNDNSYSVIVNNTINTSNPDSSYLWKLQKIESGYFYDVYTIVSKADSSRYLCTNGAYLNTVTGIGSGREQATRYWKFSDTTVSVKKIKTTHKSNSTSYAKPFTFASTYNNLKSNKYFGAYIDDAVIDSCEKICSGNIYEYDRFNHRGLLEIISESSSCVIASHGSSNSIECQDCDTKTETSLGYLYINEQIPDNYLTDTKFVLLLSCETSSTTTDNIAALLQEKGVETVVGFEDTIYSTSDPNTGDIQPNEAALLYASTLLEKLSSGETVESAVELTYDDIYSRYENTLSISSEDSEKHKNGFYNLDSAKIYGNKNLSF